jgi:hypothetical protein
MVIGEHFTGPTQHDSSTGTSSILIAQLGVDIHHTGTER